MSLTDAIVIIILLLILMRDKLFDIVFDKKFNNITDYNHPDFTGGIAFEFNPLRHISAL